MSAKTKRKKRVKSQGDFKRLKVLIVDDQTVNRTLARIYLELRNFDIREAVNGREALDLMTDKFNPDLILMDICMPIMDGVEATKRIRGNKKINIRNIPIIAFTSGDHDASESELLEGGFSEYILKPFDKSELFNKIGKFIPVAS